MGSVDKAIDILAAAIIQNERDLERISKSRADVYNILDEYQIEDELVDEITNRLGVINDNS